MLVNKLETMEKIVSSRSDLSWDGWDVVKYSPGHNAQYSPSGVFMDGSWMKKKVFPLTEQGWNLPSNLGSAHAQVEK
jgi:hypothetical protein